MFFVGDPDDRTLRNVEKDVLIPRKYVKPEAHKRCSEFVKGLLSRMVFPDLIIICFVLVCTHVCTKFGYES